jgi:hypothetical protein
MTQQGIAVTTARFTKRWSPKTQAPKFVCPNESTSPVVCDAEFVASMPSPHL